MRYKTRYKNILLNLICYSVCLILVKYFFRRTKLQSEEIVAELVTSFLLPEVQKITVREKGESMLWNKPHLLYLSLRGVLGSFFYRSGQIYFWDGRVWERVVTIRQRRLSFISLSYALGIPQSPSVTLRIPQVARQRNRRERAKRRLRRRLWKCNKLSY